MIKRKSLIALTLLLLFTAGSTAMAQSKLGYLRSWAGKYPTHKAGRLTKNFFQVTAIQRPLLALLSRRDFNLLTRAYKVETPIKQIGDYLAVKVCRPHNCNTEQAGFAINLSTGFIYVRMQNGQESRWFGSRGDYTDLPQDVQDYLTDFSVT